MSLCVALFYRKSFSQNSVDTAPRLDGGKVIHPEEHINAISKYCDLGFPGLGASFVCSGAQVPFHIAALARVPFAYANIGLAGGYATQTEAVMRLLPNYANINHSSTVVGDMAQGLARGAMCLSEDHSLSSLSHVRCAHCHSMAMAIYTSLTCLCVCWCRCRAEYDYYDRVYKVTGTKTCVYGAANDFEGNTVSDTHICPALPCLSPDRMSLVLSSS